MVKAEIIQKYFPEISNSAYQKIQRLYDIYFSLNEKVNLISRKDFDNFYIHHVLHSLSLAKTCTFPKGSKVLDIGTGGGFPGIPLAIFYPEIHFILADSIGKKIRAVQEVADILELDNVTALNTRIESLQAKVDIVVARAVAPAVELYTWVLGKWAAAPCFYLLKGGDLTMEMQELQSIAPKLRIKEIPISDYFSEPFFETKKVIQIQG
ncbi:MAG: 16S rRNA (guanine(527)-N(7))-methyltransferase RsmG [Bacteroidetes bacterium]|nr:16S rRNA (guanine(527)-N(7))-methyltransferase RsmG [Bacteroidota bacterium]